MELLPAGRERRAANRASAPVISPARARYAPRTVAAVIDTACICSIALIASRLTGIGFWPLAGATAITYQTAATVVVGSSLGTRAVDLLRVHAPSLFAVVASGREPVSPPVRGT
jgi:hypothetical protein